ncbi:MAG: flagellar basal body rod protein FlgB [Geobacter sp.]|nr:flagellar basal body rod protein FlgB [Geobacter sp.]
MPIDGIFGSTIELLSKNIDLRAKNHNQISANLANAETPNYVPSTLSFEGELRDALKSQSNNKNGATGSLTNPRHIPLKGMAGGVSEVHGTVIQTPAAIPGRDGNAVEMEQEMGSLASNQIMFNASVQMLNKKFEGLKLAIKGQ